MKACDKRFLTNNPEEFGSVGWGVKTNPEDYYKIQAELRITDCYEKVTLDFNCEKEKHIDKRIQKLDNLIESLNLMRDSLVEAKSETFTNKRGY